MVARYARNVADIGVQNMPELHRARRIAPKNDDVWGLCDWCSLLLRDGINLQGERDRKSDDHNHDGSCRQNESRHWSASLSDLDLE